jgi:hypothetical protein
MRDGWYFLQGKESIGPISLKALAENIRTTKNPADALVWHHTLNEWTPAGKVTALSKFFPKAARVPNDIPRENDKTALLLAGIIALITAGTITTVVYGNSASGIGYVFGQFVGAAFLASLLGIAWRNSPRYVAGVVTVAAMTIIVSNWNGVVRVFEMKTAVKSLEGVRDPTGIGAVAQKNPSNVMLQLINAATTFGQETLDRSEILFNGIEPTSLAGNSNFATLSKAELIGLSKDLKTASSRASAALLQYFELLKQERIKFQEFAINYKLGDEMTRDLLSGVDRRHKTTGDFTKRMIQARIDLYQSIDGYLSILIAQSGRYSVLQNGQVQFSDPSALARYNTAQKQVEKNVARITELEKEGVAINESLHDRREKILSGETSR